MIWRSIKVLSERYAKNHLVPDHLGSFLAVLGYIGQIDGWTDKATDARAHLKKEGRIKKKNEKE